MPASGRYTIRAELLYLRPHIDNLSLNKTAIQNAFSGFPGTVVTFTNDERKRRYQWRYGWKVGLGFACFDCWEADLNWTHYQSKAKLADFRGVDTKWKVHLDTIDLEIGNERWWGRSIRVKPYIGLRFAEIRQRYKFRVEGNVQTALMPGNVIPFQIRGVLRHIYYALGPRIGVDASWMVGCGFNIYLKASANYLYGEMQNRYKDNLVISGLDRDRFWQGTGMTDFSIGLGWSDLWWNERRRLTFRFGYENHYLIRENKLTGEGVISGHTKNWFVQGVAGSMAVDF